MDYGFGDKMIRNYEGLLSLTGQMICVKAGFREFKVSTHSTVYPPHTS